MVNLVIDRKILILLSSPSQVSNSVSKIYIAFLYQTVSFIYFMAVFIILKTYAANLHAQISCVGKQGKLSGSCLSTIYGFGSIQFSETLMSDGYFNTFLTKQSN